MKRNFKDLCGKKFGRLTVLSCAPSQLKGIHWDCRCDCGKKVSVRGDCLKLGNTRSCGCLQKETVSKIFFKHGGQTDGKKTRTYLSWDGMIQRCLNPKNSRFRDYGGRGIGVCEDWKKFENFLRDMGERPPKLTLDRKDNNGNYDPLNCRWADWETQFANRRKRLSRTQIFQT